MAEPEQNRSAMRRTLTMANLGSFLLGAVIFVALTLAWDSYAGAVTAALIAALIASGAWWLWTRAHRPPATETGLEVPDMGQVPAYDPVPAPTLSDPQSDAALSYEALAASVPALTDSTVLLVAGPAPGSGASSVALNLAISSTRAGKKVVLIDGDVETGGLTKFTRTRTGPGLVELAAGEADLAAASRLWQLDPQNRLPFIPTGQAASPNGSLTSAPVADAVDRLSETADLVLIDSSPAIDGASIDLAAHADGALLVVPSQMQPDSVKAASDRLEAAGAPVVGYVVNGTPPYRPATWKRALLRGVAFFALALLALMLWNALQIWDSWNSADRQNLDVIAAATLLPLPAEPVASESGELDEEEMTSVTTPPRPADEFRSFLIVGSDLGGARADVIMLLLQPGNGRDPLMVSLPRDLWLPNRCTQNMTRINVNLRGCGDEVNGTTLMALAVEDFTGVPVDHVALFDFTGFERIIDEMGGVDICVEHAVRDYKSHLDLPAGCTTATGEQALSWVRSRSTQEYANGQWRRMPGANDLSRNQNQQDVVLAMMQKSKGFNSVGDLSSKFRSLTTFFTFDDQLGFTEAVALAWSLRDLDLDTVERIAIPIKYHTTSGGASVLLPKISFGELLDEIYPPTQVPS